MQINCRKTTLDLAHVMAGVHVRSCIPELLKNLDEMSVSHVMYFSFLFELMQYSLAYPISTQNDKSAIAV